MVALAAALMLGASASAQTPQTARWPEKPVHFIVFVPPGGIHDTLARLLQPRLSQALGQPIVIENRPGAGGNIAAEAVAKSAPDGYTFLVASEAMATNRLLYRSLDFDPDRALAPVTKIAGFPQVLAVNPSVPARSVQELVELARARPGALSYSSAGIGTSGHLGGELFASLAGIDLVHVPYKGGAAALSDVVAGRVPMLFISVALAAPLAEQGKLRILAIAAQRRSPKLPAVPTLAEAGFPQYELQPYSCLYAPAATPAAIVVRLAAEVGRALAAPEIERRLEDLGMVPEPTTPEEFAAEIRRERERIGRLIRERNIRAD